MLPLTERKPTAASSRKSFAFAGASRVPGGGSGADLVTNDPAHFLQQLMQGECVCHRWCRCA